MGLLSQTKVTLCSRIHTVGVRIRCPRHVHIRSGGIGGRYERKRTAPIQDQVISLPPERKSRPGRHRVYNRAEGNAAEGLVHPRIRQSRARGAGSGVFDPDEPVIIKRVIIAGNVKDRIRSAEIRGHVSRPQAPKGRVERISQRPG